MTDQGKIATIRWWRIMPVVFFTYSFAYLDRVNFGFASAGGMGHDLGLSSGIVSFIAALFFLGYFCGQVPGAIYAENRSAKKLVFWCLILWGGLSSLTGVVSNVAGLMVVRFLLGVVEAAVFPALIVFINHWFTRRERSVANTFVILSSPITIMWMSVVSGYLVHSFGWRAMFIAEGVPSVVWGVVWWFAVQDHPSQAAWLSREDREALETRIAEEQSSLKPVRNYGDAFRSLFVIRFAALYFFWALGLFGLNLWLPSILRQAGSSMVQTGWLAAGPYVLTSIAMVCVSVGSDRAGVRKPFVWPFLLASAIAFLLLFALHPLTFWASYALLSIAAMGLFAPMPTFFAILPEVLPQRVAGASVALINSFGALGGFFGSYLVGLLSGLTGNPAASCLLMGVSLVLAAGLFLTTSESPN